MGQVGDYQDNEKGMHDPDKDLAQLLTRQEDRLIMVSLPALVGALILWGLAGAYPSEAAILNVWVSSIVLLVSCVVAVRLSEIGWRLIVYIKDEDVDPFPILGLIALIFLALFGTVGVVTMMMHADQATDARAILMGFLVAILVLLYREIIIRYSRSRSSKEEE